MDVITKEGALFLQGVKFGKKVWRKTWLILFDPSSPGKGRIELYDTREGWGFLGSSSTKPAGLKKTDKRMIRLSDCLSITPAPDESCPVDCSAFFLNTTSRTYTIAAPTNEDWMSALCQLAFQKSNEDEETGDSQRDKCKHLADNELYSSWGVGQFQVKIQSTDASQRCGMSGSYLLSVKKDVISLLDLKTGQAIHSWPYRTLRRFGQVKGGIAFEVGRQCHTGAGHFIFSSNQSSQIYKAIEEAVMHHSVQELLAEATAPPQESAPHPPSPDEITQDRSKVSKLPPIKTNQNRPYPVVQRKKGQQIHKAIEDALINQNVAPSTAFQKKPLLPPAPSKPRTQDRPKGKNMVTSHPPVSMNPKRQGPPVMQKQRQLTNSSDEKAHIYSNVQEPPSQSNPRPLPCVPVSRRNISLPDIPSSSLNCPGDVLYASVHLSPNPRSKVNLPRVPTPPSLPAHFNVHISEDKDVSIDQKWNSLQEPSKNNDEDNPYMNWMVNTNAEQDQPHTDVLYSTVNFAAKNRKADIDGQEHQDQQSSLINSTIDFEVPVDFKQTLSNILLKERCKTPSSYPARSHGGSSDGLDRKDDEMTH